MIKKVVENTLLQSQRHTCVKGGLVWVIINSRVCPHNGIYMEMLGSGHLYAVFSLISQLVSQSLLSYLMVNKGQSCKR